MNTYHLDEFTRLSDELDISPLPEIITQAKSQIAAAKSLRVIIDPPSFIGATESEMIAWIRDTQYSLAAEGSDKSFRKGTNAFIDMVAAELEEGVQGPIDDLIETVRPRFEAAVLPIVEASAAGVTLSTSANWLAHHATPEELNLWRALRDTLPTVQRLAEWRICVATTFADHDLPKLDLSDVVNHSILFASGDNWHTTKEGAAIAGNVQNGIDWSSIAAGGITLNTSAEVDAKIAARRNAQAVSAITPLSA